ncbi:MAG: SUMF1/EgtB/PvdO family nonheme iron enzyme [Planctomycetota bacterium]|nr:SUMF1/EgtB/PvdO family nonheme iron enzyme [Planctomycetota bacterium]
MNTPSSVSANSTVQLIRVFVSSPSDVAEERDVLDEVVQRINNTAGQALGARLELWKWEDHAVPQIGPRTKAVVDAQTPADYDIYLGLLAHRFGTPTGRYGSGTEKEFRDALKRWGQTAKPWMLFYFKTTKVDPAQLDLAQYAKVRKFREQVEKNEKGLYATYTQVRGSNDAFFEQVETHLRNVLHMLLPRPAPPTPASPPGPPPPAADPGVPAAYRAWLARECSGVELLGLNDQQGRAVQLYQVYVPLTTATHSEEPGRGSDAAAEREAGLRLPGGETERTPELLLDQLAENSLYVEGGAGSGKSTFCRWVAGAVNAGDLPTRGPDPPKGYAEHFPEPLRDHLPLLVRLRDFWAALPSAPGGGSLARGELLTALHRWLDEKQPGGLSWACVRGHLERGRLLLMLDGCDEVPIRVGADAAAYHPRAMLLTALVDAVPHWTAAGNRVLLTSRPYGLNADEAQRLGLRQLAIAELDGSLQELLIRRWFATLAPDAVEAGQRADDLRSHLAERLELAPLVASPMLLTALCVIFNQGKRLPRDKHELYDRVVDNVLHNRYIDEQQEIPLVRNRLSVIAYGLHTGAGLDEERDTPQAEGTHAEIEQLIQRYRDESPATEPGFKGAVQACDDLLTRSGLLLPLAGKRAGFYHLTFQDFLAAQLILERESDLPTFFRRHAARAEWRSTLSFVFSSLMSRNTLPDKGIRLLENLIEPLTLETLALAVVVADCLEILAGRGVGLQTAQVERFRRLCLESIEREVPVASRCELWRVLGRLGDPRICDDLRDQADPRAWVEVPVGKYTVGGGKAYFIEPLKKRKVQLREPFRMSRYPVTNSQFRRFLDDGGYQQRGCWSDEGWQWREQNDISLWWVCRSGKPRRSPAGPVLDCPANWNGKSPRGVRKRSLILGETSGRTASAIRAN